MLKSLTLNVTNAKELPKIFAKHFMRFPINIFILIFISINNTYLFIVMYSLDTEHYLIFL